MTALLILTAFELEINKIDNTVQKPVTDDSTYWINQAIVKYAKQAAGGTAGSPGDRFHAAAYGKMSFELTELSRNNIKRLIVTEKYTPAKTKDNADYDEYAIDFPDKFMYELSENVEISDLDGKYITDTCAFECTYDSFMYRINNSLTDFHYRRHKARPLRLRTKTGCILMTDKQYKINKYVLSYLRNPEEYSLEDPHKEYLDFETNTMYEIVKLAAQMYLENQKDERYSSISNEVLNQ